MAFASSRSPFESTCSEVSTLSDAVSFSLMGIQLGIKSGPATPSAEVLPVSK